VVRWRFRWDFRDDWRGLMAGKTDTLTQTVLGSAAVSTFQTSFAGNATSYPTCVQLLPV
jgi:hypothetical protein